MKIAHILPVVAAATLASVPGLSAAQATPVAIDVSGVSMTPMQTVFNDLFTTHIPTIVAIAAVGFAIGAVIVMIRKAKSVAK